MRLQKLEKFFSPKDLFWLSKYFGQSRDKWFQSVFLYITEKCQLKCKHCYLGWRLKRKSEMPFDQIISHLKMWKEIGAKRVCFIGGEPTLHPKLKEAIEYANNLGYEEVVMDTNGIPPALNILSNIGPSKLTYIQVSLDGASPEIHDKIRGRGTFKITLNTIKELCNRGFDVRIITTVNKLNMKDCLDLPKIAGDIGVSLVKYHICSNEGRGKENPHLIFDPPEWKEFIEILSEKGKKYKTKILYQPAYADEKTGYQYFKEGYKGCIGRQLNKISIFPDNKMYLCSYLFDTDLNFAEMTNGKIRIKKSFSELILFTNQNEECKKCQFNKICMGGCPAENLIKGFLICKKYPNVFPLCRLWKTSI
jgi:radical SAM protein with 4Fe4S-binding SPASM domain